MIFIFINPLKDIVFKTLLLNGSKETKEYLNRMISNITGIDVKNYDVTMQELGVDNYQGIASRLDIILVSPDKGIKINIEVNKSKSRALLNKNKTYICKLAGNYYNDLDEKYNKDIKVIQINFNNYKNSINNTFLNRFYFYDKEYEIEDKSIQIYQFYLPYFKNICYDKRIDINNDYALLTCESFEEMEKYVNNNSERKAFVIDMKKLSSDEAFANLIDYDEYEEALLKELKENALKEGIKEGKKEGVKEGIKEGIIKNQEAVVKKMLDKKIDIKLISEITNLSIEEIEKISK